MSVQPLAVIVPVWTFGAPDSGHTMEIRIMDDGSDDAQSDCSHNSAADTLDSLRFLRESARRVAVDIGGLVDILRAHGELDVHGNEPEPEEEH